MRNILLCVALLACATSSFAQGTFGNTFKGQCKSLATGRAIPDLTIWRKGADAQVNFEGNKIFLHSPVTGALYPTTTFFVGAFNNGTNEMVQLDESAGTAYLISVSANALPAVAIVCTGLVSD